MRRFSVALGLIALSAGVGLAQQTRTFQRVDVTDGPVAIADGTLQPVGQSPVTRCTARLETAQIRFADSRAVTVSATTGRVLEIGDVIDLESPSDVAFVRFAKTGSTTGVLMLECGR